MKIWTVVNQKGGVGKTTTAVNLAGILAKRGERTLIIDLDPHGSMTSYFGLVPDGLVDSVYSLFKEPSGQLDLDKILRATDFDNLTLLPASTALATLDRQLGTKEGMGLVLIKHLKKLANQFDYVVIDCPPMLGILMINAIATCDKLIIPVQTEFLAIKGLERMLHTLSMINKARKNALPYVIVPTLFDRRTKASKEALQHLRDSYASPVLWDSLIPVDTNFREASSKGYPLCQLHPDSRGVHAYADLLDSLVTV